VKTFKFRETLELIKMGNPEPTPFSKVKKKIRIQKARIKKRIGAETQRKLF
jgi:hypothetical protein